MKLCQQNGLKYYRFDIFDPFPQLAHGVFTRQGGVSPEPCQGLNLAFMPDDDEANVRANLDLAAETLGFAGLSVAGQVHGTNLLEVNRENPHRARRASEVERGYDALVTREPGLGLLIKLADCQGVLLFDPATKVVAVVHSGWRGSAANIIGATVARLTDEHGVRPADLLAGITPSLGPCCGEFVNYRDELPRSFWDFRVGENHFDFWAVSRAQLTEAGLRPENIEVAEVCTVCSEEFYSYRRDKTTGRFGLVAGVLKEKAH